MKHWDSLAKAVGLLDAGFGYKAVAARLDVHKDVARKWEYAYRALGKEGLLSRNSKSYSQDEKLEAVRLFLDEGLSKPQVMELKGIKSLSALERWIRDYRRGGAEALAPKPRGRRAKPESPVYATREEELEARVRELELELEIQKRINALADEAEQRSHRR